MRSKRVALSSGAPLAPLGDDHTPGSRQEGVWGGIRAVGQVLEQRPVAGVFEKAVQMFEYVFLGFGVLIGELEHHSADEDLAAGVCFSFTG